MAQLSDADRRRVWRGLMRYWSRFWEPVGDINKSDLLTAVNVTDVWIENNQASYSAALPESAKTELTLAQKTFLFCCVAAMRVSVEVARQLLGEID